MRCGLGPKGFIPLGDITQDHLQKASLLTGSSSGVNQTLRGYTGMLFEASLGCFLLGAWYTCKTTPVELALLPFSRLFY